MFIAAMVSGALVLAGIYILTSDIPDVMCIPTFGLALSSLIFSGVFNIYSGK